MEKVKTLYLDIETSSATVSTFSIWNTNIGINQISIPISMISFAAKWEGSRTTMFYSTFHNGKEEMVKQAHRLLSECDCLVTYNGNNFDIKHLNREFLQMGLLPPSPYKSLDLMVATKAKFRFMSNKLQWISTQLGLSGKVQHEGFGLWEKCLAGDKAAWNKMRTYNKKDVTLLEDLHKILLPWIDNGPNKALIDGVENGCRNCAGTNFERRGYYYTYACRYQRFVCKDCGKWSRSNKPLAGVTMVEAR